MVHSVALRFVPRPAAPSIPATVVILLGIGFASITFPGTGAVDVFSHGALITGIVLVIALAIEGSSGIRGIVRTDLVLLIAFYGLTFLEFLFPQDGIDATLSVDAAKNGSDVALLAFAGLAIGRHMMWPFYKAPSTSAVVITSNKIFALFIGISCLGYLHILLAVQFDIVEAIRQMSLPRFSQSWGRGRLGDAAALLVEIGALIYLIPPLAGAIFARRRNFPAIQKLIVSIILGLTFYYGFSGGTRNILATYAITFISAYFIAQSRLTLSKAILVGIPLAVLAAAGIFYMLAFRSVGLANYSFETPEVHRVFIDGNLIVISRLTEVFPAVHEYLGFEIPLNAVIRPIPRALWPGKPEGLSTGIEFALGVSDRTLAATFAGEAYMAAGLIGVVIASLLFGIGSAAWNRVGADMGSLFKQVLYTSGFLTAAMGMRSIMSMVPFMLPTIALWLYGHFFLGPTGSGRSRLRDSSRSVEPS